MSKTVEQNLVSLLPALVANRGATAEQIGATTPKLNALAGLGLVKRVGKVSTGKRGRPAIQWAATDKGRKRAKRVGQAA